jgi:uncharacterized protein (TIGR03437 family)
MRDNGVEVRRLAESRSVRFREEGDEAYWAEPRAAISNDGSLVVADSNFGMKAGVRVTLIRPDAGKPLLASTGVMNAADRSSKIAPGAYAILEGTGLANCTATAASTSLPDNLCGVRITFNQTPAKLVAASPERINVLTPRSLTPLTSVQVAVSIEGVESGVSTTVADADFNEVAPAIFSYASDDGLNRALMASADGALNGPGLDANTTPARLGETQVVYANALGPTDQTVADGDPAPGDPPARTLRTVDVFVNGVRQETQFAGLAPGQNVAYQVNFVLSGDTPVNPEGQNLIWLNVNGVESAKLPISLWGGTAAGGGAPEPAGTGDQ